MRNDRDLVRQVIGGSEEAAAEFVDRFARFVYAILQRNLRFDRDTADELFQEFFARLWEDDCRRLRMWRGEGDLAAYLAPIVRNLGLGHLRSAHGPLQPGTGSNPDPCENLLDPDPTPEEQAAVREQRRQLASAVETLRPRDRKLYRLRFEEQRSYREIATELEMNVNSVGVALVRLEQRLQKSLSRTGTVGESPPPCGTEVRTARPGASRE